jgi:prepilin-type N-terminal cleavage/methylation domain-containing protein
LKKSARGFTLVELLVVIAIIAILAAVVVLIINPLELTKRGRDSARLTDLANLQQAINVAVQEATASGSQILCNGAAYPCNGSSNTGSRTSDGGGWVKVNLSAQQSVSVPTLPIDPTNNAQLHYTYCASNTGGNDAWEIDAALESSQQSGKMSTDGGNEDDRYEVGSNLTLIGTQAGAACTY